MTDPIHNMTNKVHKSAAKHMVHSVAQGLGWLWIGERQNGRYEIAYAYEPTPVDRAKYLLKNHLEVL